MDSPESSQQEIQRQQTSLRGESATDEYQTPARSDSMRQECIQSMIVIGVLIVSAVVFMTMFYSRTGLSSTHIPRKLWVYSTSEQELQDMPFWLADNLEQFASESGFKVQKITAENYGNFVSQSRKASISRLTDRLNKTIGTKSNKTDAISKDGHLLLRQLIALAVLLEHGGVIMTDDLVLTEDITWIDRVYSNPYVIRKDKNRTEVVGFFDPRFSHPKHRQDSDDPTHAPYKYLWRAPALSCSFLASIPNSQFINKLVQEVTKTLSNVELRLPWLRIQVQNPEHKDWMEDYHPLAGISRVVFRNRSQQLDQSQLPVDSYSVSLINVFYGPAKIFQQFMWIDPSRFLHYLTNLSQQQLITYVGPLQYAQHLPRRLKPDTFTQIQKSGRYIMEDSLFARLFPRTFSGGKYANPQRDFINHNATRWETLPKKIWIIWNGGLQKAPLFDQIAYAIAVKVANRSGFEVNLLQFSDCRQYVDEGTCTKIEKTVNDKTHPRHPTTPSDLLRLALLHKHGGIYMDIATILRGDLQWLLDVAKLPSQYVFNRYGPLPRMLTMFYTLSGGPGRWVVDPVYKTKTFQHIGLDNSFIAVEKEHQLIREWFDLTIQLLNMSYDQISSTFDKCGVIEDRYIAKGSTYAMPMESVSCVVGRRQHQLAIWWTHHWANAYDFYDFWQINGQLGSQKYRHYNNLEGLDNRGYNPFLTEYSEEYVNGLIGKPLTPFIKTVSHQTAKTSKLLQNAQFKMHPESFLARAMKQNQLQLRKVEGKMAVVPAEH